MLKNCILKTGPGAGPKVTNKNKISINYRQLENSFKDPSVNVINYPDIQKEQNLNNLINQNLFPSNGEKNIHYDNIKYVNGSRLLEVFLLDYERKNTRYLAKYK